MASAIGQRSAHVIVYEVSSFGGRAAPLETLRRAFPGAECVRDASTAIATARERTTGSPVVAIGSFVLAGEIIALLRPSSLCDEHRLDYFGTPAGQPARKD